MMAAHTPIVVARPPRASRYSRRVTPQISIQFLGTGQVVALCIAMLVLGVLLFPKAYIDRQLHTTAPPNATTIAYLQLLLRAQPEESTTRMQLVRQRLRAGQLQQAESDLVPLIKRPGPPPEQVGMMWLTLRRAQFLATPAESPQRILARARYSQALSSFGSQLSPAQELGEIQQAIKAGLYEVAAGLAGHLLTITAPVPAVQASPAGRAPATVNRLRPGESSAHMRRDVEPGLLQMIGLVWSSRFERHADAPERSSSDRASLRQQAFAALLQSHLAAGHPAAALAAAEAVLPTLDDTQIDWAQLIQIAIWANQPATAAGFAGRWLASARDDSTRWAAFHALTDAYLATGDPAQALAAATLHLQQMPQTAELWRLMTQLAMQAGDAEQAARYARRLVGLGVVGAH
jgi:hypothetical protein